ncbi:hypothetical protein TRFO_30822 [Tritrichomonas foetus]|uniref:PTHB1 N-terminal domain-containing protein n=1 Tax=Tritrichomonas foetus TaxID=1144522 RepID=A0A1J4JUL9_9EUKA|nr:hypothetical protein TRFO_30822 [Tritrichomonas foetus]|eukprot:OHT02168.1 hypothetical protein TRFO_30822 [Tritrichomonas foetus]
MFHLRNLWESDRFPNEEFSPDAFCSLTFEQQTCLVTGSFSGILRIYFPTKAGPSAPHTEIPLKAPILQIEYGNFIKGSNESLAILYPTRLVLYDIKQDQTTMIVHENQSFTLSHSPYNFISTHLEGASKPKQIIVQSTDGYLTILSTLTPVSYKIPHFFLPAPFCYIPILESFIFASSDYKIACYRKTIIAANHGEGEPVEEWSYIFGEQVVSLHFWQAKTKFVSASSFEIAVVGERMLAILNESGRIKSIAKHNGNAVNSHAYTAVNEKNKSCNNLLISSFDKNICVYLNFQKVWQLTLDQPAIAVTIIDIKPNQGLLAIMGIDGQLIVGYLGTHDSKGLGLPKLPIITEEQLKKHIEKVNERINGAPTQNLLQVFVNVSRSSPKHVEIVLQSQGNTLNDVNCFIDTPPTITYVPPFSIPQLNKDEATFQIELNPTDSPPAQQTIKINATFSTSERRILSKNVEFDIPFELFVRRVETRVKGKNKLILHANGGFATLGELFPNLVLKSPHEMSLSLTNGDIVSISIDSKNKRYRLESDEYGELGFGISILSHALQKAAKATLSSKDKISIAPLLTIAKEHYNLRCQERELQKTIHANVGELESVQKALIVRYEAATPEPINDLNELLTKVTEVIKESTKQLLELQAQIKKVAAQVEAHVFTVINMLIVVYGLSDKTSQLLKLYIPLNVQDCSPGWEECVVVCIPALLKKIASGKAGHNFGSTPEFLSSFDVLVDAFEALMNFFASKYNSK